MRVDTDRRNIVIMPWLARHGCEPSAGTERRGRISPRLVSRLPLPITPEFASGSMDAMKILPFELERRLRGLKFRLSRKLPDRHPSEVWRGVDTAAVLLRPFAGEFGNLQRYELMVVCAVARHLGARRLFEFGTFDGLTTWHLAVNSGPDAHVSTLDLPLDHPARSSPRHDRSVGRIHRVSVGAQFAETAEASRIEQLYGDSLEFDAEPYRRSIDLCFIDASHEYTHVCRDTANALLMTRPGGVIFWHDYSRWWPGVQKCLDDLSEEQPVFRVRDTALAALCVRHVEM